MEIKMPKWFAIFRTGKHTDSNGNTREWTEADLDKIVESYDPSKHEAPIVIGHPKSNAPAFGWIEKLKRVGDTLYALPKQLAQEFVEMVNKGLFKKRSISLYPDGTLRHVGFLGATPPAVKGLPDVEFSDEYSTLEIEQELQDYQEADQPTIDELKQYIAQLEGELVTKNEMLNNLQATIDALKQENEKLKNQIIELMQQVQVKNFEEKVQKLISEGKLLPKLVPQVKKMYEVIQSKTMDFEEGEALNSFYEFLENLPKVIQFDEVAKKKEDVDDKNISPIQRVAEEIRKSMSI
jgi:hypothetical protein